MNNIVFFDGYCVLCNGLVDILIARDKKDRLKFSSLQGKTAADLLPEKLIKNKDTIVFFSNSEHIHLKSDAILKIAQTIGGIWRLSGIFYLIPVFIRNFIYDYIASRRFKWFGKRTQCRIPDEKDKNKILN
jgi:predicted DCC family thiol-disulfide oxidoreductase YuxK